MKTAARADILAEAIARIPLLGRCTTEDLLELVERELGHREILDGFRPYGSHFSKAAPLDPLLHIVSGNTPHAALQSLVRGLLLGARNLVKLPSAGLTEVDEFLANLPAELRALVETSAALPEEWLTEAGACIVFGSDETIRHFRAQTSGILEAHGHRWSIGVIFQPSDHAASLAATDVSLFNQKGCLSPHDLYVAGDARAFAAQLATAMEKYSARDPATSISAEEAAEVYETRARYRFRSATDPTVQVWESLESLEWTVIYEDDPAFRPSCLNRVVFVKPLPAAGLNAALGSAMESLGGVAIWPATPENADVVAGQQPSRICPLGLMQYPAWTWHQEGRQVLAPLVRWIDFEPDIR